MNLADAKAGGDYQAVVDTIPYNVFLGLQVRADDNGLICVLPGDRKLVGNPVLPALHGGVVGAFLESAAIMELIYVSDTVHVPKTITFTIDFLRSAKPIETFARARVTKHGRRIANVRVEAWQDDPERPVAAAIAHLLLA